MDFKQTFKTLVLTGTPEEQIAALRALRAAQLPKTTISLVKAPVKAVRKVRKADDEYVYDIGMRNEEKPWYFGNNILIHNSVYFSAYNTFKHDIKAGIIPWTKDSVVQLYDKIGEEVNATFPQFMNDTFSCPLERGSVIKAGREIVGTKALFITKKRYAVLYYDKEGKRYDSDTSSGKIKAMGLDLKRSDTPTYMQDFLLDVLTKVLNGASESEILAQITEFRTTFRAMPAWEKGSPKRVNNLTAYHNKEEAAGKATMPGHVRAALNWNTLRRMAGDTYSMSIVDGAKTVVCKLKPNPIGFTSVGYPVDEMRLPDWFTSLPFDETEMENVIFDGRIENLLGVLKWDLDSTKSSNTFNSLFDFT